MTAPRTGRALSRRAFLGAAGAGLVAAAGLAAQAPGAAQALDTLQGSGAAGRLWDPTWAGRPLEPTTAQDNDPGIQAIEKRLKCTCGCGLDIYTCRTTDFSCTVSPRLHKEVLALARERKTPNEILATFVQRYGEQELMAPPRRGFNLVGYFLPGTLVAAAAVLLTIALRRWTRHPALATAGAAGAGMPAASPEELARLRDELDRLDI